MLRTVLTALILLVAGTVLAGQFVADESDFTCLRDWTKVHHMRVFHRKPKKLKKAIAIIEAGEGKRLPKGTFLQIFPNEAMVKRGGKFNKESGGWEFFALGVSSAGTTIIQRGGAEVLNQFGGGPCQTCHAPAADFDFLCETDHGCTKLPDFVTPELLEVLQQNDPRCTPAE